MKKIFVFILFLSLSHHGYAQSSQEYIAQSLEKEIALTKEMLQVAEQMLLSQDLNQDFKAYLAAKNQHITILENEIETLRRQLPDIMRPASLPTAQESQYQQELEALQSMYSETLEKLNDAVSQYVSLEHDYENNIDKLAIYAKDNQRLLADRQQLRDQAKFLEQSLKEQFYIEKKALLEKVDYLTRYNEELISAKDALMVMVEDQEQGGLKNRSVAGVMAPAEKTVQPATAADAADAESALDYLQVKYDQQREFIKVLTMQKKELMNRIGQSTLIPSKPKYGTIHKESAEAYEEEIKQLEQALNQKERYYNSLVRENEELKGQLYTAIDKDKGWLNDEIRDAQLDQVKLKKSVEKKLQRYQKEIKKQRHQLDSARKQEKILKKKLRKLTQDKNKLLRANDIYQAKVHADARKMEKLLERP